MSPPIVLGASCAVWREDRVLIVLRRNPPRVWSLPGGRVEPGETVAEAALRELTEETGLRCTEVHFVGLIEAIDVSAEQPHHFVVAVHATQHRGGEPLASGDAAETRWLTPDETDLLETTGGLKDMLLRSKAVLRR